MDFNDNSSRSVSKFLSIGNYILAQILVLVLLASTLILYTQLNNMQDKLEHLEQSVFDVSESYHHTEQVSGFIPKTI